MHKMLSQQIFFSTHNLSKIKLKRICIIYAYTGWLVSKRRTRTLWIWLESPYKNGPYVDNKIKQCAWIGSDGINGDDDDNEEKGPNMTTGGVISPLSYPHMTKNLAHGKHSRNIYL